MNQWLLDERIALLSSTEEQKGTCREADLAPTWRDPDRRRSLQQSALHPFAPLIWYTHFPSLEDSLAGVDMNIVQSPLTLIMNIKSPEDFAQLNGLLTKIQSAPPEQNPIWVALTKLKTVHFARFVFLSNNTQLAVITTYDGDFDKYINDFIDTIGDVFNALLSHMQGAPTLPVQQNRDAFLAYVKQNDLRGMDPFYSAYPTASVVTILDALNQG
jgi:hypothetical protein